MLQLTTCRFVSALQGFTKIVSCCKYQAVSSCYVPLPLTSWGSSPVPTPAPSTIANIASSVPPQFNVNGAVAAAVTRSCHLRWAAQCAVSWRTCCHRAQQLTCHLAPCYITDALSLFNMTCDASLFRFCQGGALALDECYFEPVSSCSLRDVYGADVVAAWGRSLQDDILDAARKRLHGERIVFSVILGRDIYMKAPPQVRPTRTPCASLKLCHCTRSALRVEPPLYAMPQQVFVCLLVLCRGAAGICSAGGVHDEARPLEHAAAAAQ